MTPDRILEAFSQLTYQRDIRKRPNPLRRARFHAGWANATRPDGQVYTTETLKTLTRIIQTGANKRAPGCV